MITLVIQTSFLGDMVLTTPLLSRIADAGEVDVVGTPAAVALLANHPAVRNRIAYDKRGADRGIGGFWKIATQLRRNGYDRALLAQGSARSGVLAMAAGIRERVGFDTSAGRSLYTSRVPYVENEHHALRLLRLSGANLLTPPRPSLYPGEAERAEVDRLLRAERPEPDDGEDISFAGGFSDAVGVGRAPLLALAPGSVWATKRWPSYPQLAAALAREWRMVVIGSAADRELAREIAAAAPGRVFDATGKLSLLSSAELIGRCRVIVTNDSAPQHLASAMNVPTVAIFGPTVPAFGFGPLADRSIAVGIDSLPCRPCDRHGPTSCPLSHWKCMREVSVETVVHAVATLSAAPRTTG